MSNGMSRPTRVLKHVPSEYSEQRSSAQTAGTMVVNVLFVCSSFSRSFARADSRTGRRRTSRSIRCRLVAQSRTHPDSPNRFGGRRLFTKPLSSRISMTLASARKIRITQSGATSRHVTVHIHREVSMLPADEEIFRASYHHQSRTATNSPCTAGPCRSCHTCPQAEPLVSPRPVRHDPGL